MMMNGKRSLLFDAFWAFNATLNAALLVVCPSAQAATMLVFAVFMLVSNGYRYDGNYGLLTAALMAANAVSFFYGKSAVDHVSCVVWAVMSAMCAALVAAKWLTGGSGKSRRMKTTRPKWTDDVEKATGATPIWWLQESGAAVPKCKDGAFDGDSVCPKYDGKRCRVTGSTTWGVCEPVIAAMSLMLSKREGGT